MLLLVVGIDGLSLADAEKYGLVTALPNFRWGKTETCGSTLPSCSSFLTGLPPEEHGITPHGDKTTPHSLAAIARNIHNREEYLPKALQPYRVGMSGVPCTFPPSYVNGWLIGGILTPQGAVHVWPYEYSHKLKFSGMPKERTLASYLQADIDGIFNTTTMQEALPVDVVVHYFSGWNREYPEADGRQFVMDQMISSMEALRKLDNTHTPATILWSDHGNIDLGPEYGGIKTTHTLEGLVGTDIPDIELATTIWDVYKMIKNYVNDCESEIWDRITARYKD